MIDQEPFLVRSDYIIVGGGTAGCVLAERLSASGKDNVLVIEAGERPTNPFVKIPAGFARLFKSGCDWDYATAPQQSARHRTIYVPRGKMLGGSANMNASIHQWGHPTDFDGWSSMGAHGWAWRDVQPLFDALESQVAFETNGNTHEATSAFVATVRQLFGNSAQRYNGSAYEGAWIAEISTRRGRRHSVYDSHLRPALRRRNLTIMTGAKVDRVIFEAGRATGVILVNDLQIDANAGVILTAGAIESPTLLMRSGIGEYDHLHAMGISTQVHSPHVGRHVQDHPMVVPSFATVRSNSYKSAESLSNLLTYLFRKKGPLASNAAEAIAFVRSSPKLHLPDTELLFAPFEWRNEALASPSIHAISIGVAVAAPCSRGRIQLASKNPQAAPIIDLGLLTDDDGIDRRTMLAGLKCARTVAATAPLSEYLTVEHAPGTQSVSDEALYDWICNEVQTVYHPSCSCRMGSAQSGVVSPQLAVHGVERLWIADASVMPSLIRGHPNMAVAMIASRAAGFINAANRN